MSESSDRLVLLGVPIDSVGQAGGTEHGPAVQGVEATDREEEVFCAEVEDGHAFVLADNILTGNCFGCGAGGATPRAAGWTSTGCSR